jgi:cell division protein FtsQ
MSAASSARAARPRRGRGATARWLVVAAVLGLVAAGGYAALRASPVFAVRQVSVIGAKPKVATQVAAAARQLVAGKSLLAVDPGLLARQLAGLPAVRSVTVLRRFPHGLRIRVQAEVPVAVVSTGSGRFVLAASGRVLGPVDRTSASLPELGQITGAVPRPGGTATGSGLADQLAVAAALHGTRVTAIGISADGIAAIEGKTTLRLGDVTNLTEKLRLARAVLRASRAGGAPAPSYVDVSVPDHPVARSAGGDPTTGGSAVGTPATPPAQGPVDVHAAIADLFFPGA